MENNEIIKDTQIIENIDNQIVQKVDETLRPSEIMAVDETINLPKQTVDDTLSESLTDEMFKTYLNLKEDHKTVIKYRLEGLNNAEIARQMKISAQWVGVLFKNTNVRKILATLSEIQLNDFNERLNVRKFVDYEWAYDEYKKIYNSTKNEKLKISILDRIIRECRPTESDNSTTQNFIQNKSVTFQLPK